MKKIVRALIPRSVRNWLRAPEKSLAWGWQQFRFRLGAREVHELRLGFRLTCHPLAYRCAYSAQVDDSEQAAEYDCFIKHCSPGMVFFDIGSHFGLFAFTALHYGGSTARSLAIDPSLLATEMVSVQAKLNGIGDRLQILRACVCERNGTRNLISVGVQAAGYFIPPSGDTEKRDQTAVPAVTLDHLVETTGLQPTHIKIDVESFEESVLRGGCNLLASASAPIIFLELHNQMIRAQAQDPAGVLSLLRDYGYHTFDLTGNAAAQAALLAPDLVRFVAVK